MIVCSLVTRVSALHVWHGSTISVPVPPHTEQVRATEKNPCWNLCCPRPPHCVQVTGALPFAAPVPLQSVHVSVLRIVISFSLPKTASSNSSVRSYRRSRPRCTREALRPPLPPMLNISPNRSPKISPRSCPWKPAPP